MSIPINLSFEKIKKDLKARGLLLCLDDIESCLAVSCFLHDLYYDFSIVIEEDDNTDPFAMPREEQLTELHRFFRAELKKQGYTEKDFVQLYKQTNALSAVLLKACIVRASEAEKNKKGKK